MDGDPIHVVGQVSASGQLEVPAEFRAQLGLEGGGPVVVRVEDGELRIRALRSALDALQNQAGRVFAGSGFTVDRFLAERRDEARREGDAG